MTSAGEAAPEEHAERRAPAKLALFRFGHLAALCTFALAQPLFSLLKDNPEFFAARGATGFDIISFSVLLVLVPPLVLILIELLVGLASPPAALVVHLVFVGLLVALIAAQALRHDQEHRVARRQLGERREEAARRDGGDPEDAPIEQPSPAAQQLRALRHALAEFDIRVYHVGPTTPLAEALAS